MEIKDELVTPGCPQCAIKHLSAALSLCADLDGATAIPRNTPLELVARALINLSEVTAGYASHFDFAIGLLVRAETFAGDDVFGGGIRALRLNLMNAPAAERISCIQNYLTVTWNMCADLAMFTAHVAEARRELPGEELQCDTPEAIAATIARIRKDYFEVPGQGEGGKEVNDMAKAVAKKPVAKKPVAKAAKAAKAVPAKAKQAACKGGKCGGKKCK